MGTITNKKIRNCLLILLIAVGFTALHGLHHKFYQFNLITISEGKVYNSGVIPPEKISGVLEEKNIKTVIDLREGSLQDELNPETYSEIELERTAIAKIKNVNYFHLPTPQIPEDSTVSKFLNIMSDSINYPVLIHCHHGVGRSRLFSSIYRIEFENHTSEEARKKARLFREFAGNFSKTSSKGRYLLNYQNSQTNEPLAQGLSK